jgi:hypothetical protein
MAFKIPAAKPIGMMLTRAPLISHLSDPSLELKFPP